MIERHLYHRRRWHWLPVVPLVLAVLSTGCGQPDASLAPEADALGADPTGRIVFAADGELRLWENGSTRALTNLDDVSAASPAFTSRGDRIAYVQQSEGFSNLVVADTSGKTLVRVTANEPLDEPHGEDWAANAAWALDPAWAPDDNELVFVSDRDGSDVFSDPLFLWYVEDLQNLTRIPAYVLPASAELEMTQEDPTFAPDGERIAFVVRQKLTDTLRNTEIWTLDLETAEYAPLVVHPDGAYDPAWSPDGENVAYVQRDGDANDVWIAPADGGAPYRLTSVGSCVAPVWSPDGHFIAFFALDGTSFEARIVELTEGADGTLSASEPRTLFEVDDIDAASGMSWAP